MNGTSGIDGKNTLVKTSDEPAGSNCENGGIKIEIGLDINDDGVLEDNEVDDNLTQNICNGTSSTTAPDTNIHGVVSFNAGESASWTVPDGVFSIQLIANGSNGGKSGRTCRYNTCYTGSVGLGGIYNSVSFNINVIPGQIFTLIVGEDGIDGDENMTVNCFIPGGPGTDGTPTIILLNSDELLSINGGGGGIAGTSPSCASAPGAGTNGNNGSAIYSSGTGLLNLQTAIGQGFYNFNGSSKIRIEY